jgi:hypothetical protein
MHAIDVLVLCAQEVTDEGFERREGSCFYFPVTKEHSILYGVNLVFGAIFLSNSHINNVLPRVDLTNVSQ